MPDTEQALNQAAQRCLETGEDWDLELQIRDAASGEPKWIRSQGHLETVNGEPSALYGIVQDIDRLKKLERENIRKQTILTTLSHSIERLLEEKDYRMTLPASFKELGQAAEVDRVYLFKANRNGREVVSYSQLIEWSADSALPQIDNPELQDLPTGAMGDAHDVLGGGEPWERIIREIEHEDAREILASQGIKSVLLLPVFTDTNTYYGFVGFDDCINERKWSADERSVLWSFCSSLGAAIRRQRSERVLEQTNTDLSRLMDVTTSQNERLLNFAYITSHNIRSHAGNIQGLLNLYENEAGNNERELYFSLLKESAQKLVGTINGLNEIVSKNVSKELSLTEVFLNRLLTIRSLP